MDLGIGLGWVVFFGGKKARQQATARKEGRGKEGRKYEGRAGRKEGSTKGGQEGRREGRKEGRDRILVHIRAGNTGSDVFFAKP